MELTTSWKEEGREEGRQEGRREGRQEGRQEGRFETAQQLVLRQLRRRWGNLDAALLARVQALPLELLETLAEDLLDFSSPADLENWLGRRVAYPQRSQGVTGKRV